MGGSGVWDGPLLPSATCRSPPQVNGTNLREASHDDAINVLRQTPPRVRLVVYRDEAQYKEEELWDSFSVELRRGPGQGLGLSIVGRRWASRARRPPWPRTASDRIPVLSQRRSRDQR